jgi:hypothetical protein
MLTQSMATMKHAHAKASADTPPSLITQDLGPDPYPASQPLGRGDSVKIKYNKYLCSSEHPKGLGELVGSIGSDKPKSLKIGAGTELLGVEQGLIGMKIGAYLLYAVCCLLSAVCCVLSAVCCLSSVVRRVWNKA